MPKSWKECMREFLSKFVVYNFPKVEYQLQRKYKLFCSVFSAKKGDYYEIMNEWVDNVQNTVNRRNKADKFSMSNIQLHLFNWGIFSMQASYYTARAVQAEAVSQRLNAGLLNPRLVYLSEDLMTKAQVLRMYNYITNELRNRNLKLAFNVEDAFMDIIPVARYISGNKIKIYYFLKTTNIKTVVPKYKWYSRMQSVINKVTADDDAIDRLKAMNSDEAEVSQWVMIFLELAAIVVTCILGKNKMGQAINVALDILRKEFAKSENEAKSRTGQSVKMSEVNKP